MQFNEELDPERKGRFSIIDNWIPLADEIVADPTTLIRFAENAPGETSRKRTDDKLGCKERCDKRIYCNGDV